MKEEKVTQSEIDGMSSAVRHEINLLNILAMACDAMVFDIERRMRKFNARFRLKQEAKMRMKQYVNTLEQAKTQFDNFICPGIINCSTEDGFRDYEELRMFAQELIRLVMLYYETCLDRDNHDKVFDLLCSFNEKRRGVFTADDINEFDLGNKK